MVFLLQVNPRLPVPPWFSFCTCSGRESSGTNGSVFMDWTLFLPTSIKALKDTESTEPNKRPGFVLYSLTCDRMYVASFTLAVQLPCNNFYSARNARIASTVLVIAIPSVCPSVCHTPVLCQNDGT